MFQNIEKVVNPKYLLNFFICLFFLLFLLKGIIVLDPDFGWHYKFGEWVWKHQAIPATDTFSYTMPSYHYVNHEWLQDVLIFKTYPIIGTVGLSVIFALIAITSLVIVLPRSQMIFAIPGLIFSGGVVFDFCGVRPQIISLLFISIIIRAFTNISFYQRVRWFLPLMFLFWVNLHGAFASGIFLLVLFTIYRCFIKKLETADLLILTFSFVATLINPYSYHIWTEVFKTLTSSYLHQYIAEWQPITAFIDIETIFYMALSSTVIFLMRTKLNRLQILIFVLFLISGLSSVRNLPLFALIALPLTTEAFDQIYLKAKMDKIVLQRAILVYKILIYVCILIIGFKICYFFSNKTLSEKSSYPKAAFSYLRTHPNSAKTFTDYGWGGYLIWKNDQKTFVDGRMAIWKDHKAPQESNNAFKEYLDIVSGNDNDFLRLSKKYHIKTVVWHTPEKKGSSPKFFNSEIIQYLQNLTKPKETKPFIEKVKKAGFKKIYQDDVAVIFEKE